MRLSDLLACAVVDAAGRRVGKVRDVRVVLDGPLRGALAAPRVDALIVGGDPIGARLGYVRNEVRGPALLRWIGHRSEAKLVVISPADVAEWVVDERRLVLAPGASLRPLRG